MKLDLSSILKKQEPLCDELQNHLVKGEKFNYITHPLLISVPYFEETNALMNTQLKVRKEAAKKHLKNKNFSSYIFLHEKPYMLEAFLEVMFELNDKEYWQNLRSIWESIENNWQNLKIWKTLLNSDRGSREYFMDDEEKIFFDSLPNQITIHRGHTFNNKNGFSYTLDYEKAVWFSKRFNKKGAVLTKIIDKSDAFAYLSGEKEIIYLKSTHAKRKD